jgi:hypothetical protein
MAPLVNFVSANGLYAVRHKQVILSVEDFLGSSSSNSDCPQFIYPNHTSSYWRNIVFNVFSKVLVASALMLPLSANASIFQFNATLSGANEVLSAAPGGPGSGTATLSYNDLGTATLADDTYSFSMAVFGLTGGSVPGTAASAFHIHGAATTAQNGPVRISLDNPSLFTFLNSGTTLLVGGSNVAAPTALFTSTGYATPTSFRDLLLGGLTYVNVHTALNSGGAVRGQLLQVTVVPEPQTYGMLLAGLALIGTVVGRRKAKP